MEGFPRPHSYEELWSHRCDGHTPRGRHSWSSRRENVANPNNVTGSVYAKTCSWVFRTFPRKVRTSRVFRHLILREGPWKFLQKYPRNIFRRFEQTEANAGIWKLLQTLKLWAIAGAVCHTDVLYPILIDVEKRVLLENHQLPRESKTSTLNKRIFVFNKKVADFKVDSLKVEGNWITAFLSKQTSSFPQTFHQQLGTNLSRHRKLWFLNLFAI